MSANSKYRTFWPRFWSTMVDAAVLGVPGYFADRWVWDVVTLPALLVVWFTFASVANVTYSILCHGLWGQTLGKRLLRVRVLDVSESKLSMTQALLRDALLVGLAVVSLVVDLPTVASGKNPYDPVTIARDGVPLISTVSVHIVFGWTLLEFVTMLLNDKRRAIHDYIARSVVVRDVRQADELPAGTVPN